MIRFTHIMLVSFATFALSAGAAGAGVERGIGDQPSQATPDAVDRAVANAARSAPVVRELDNARPPYNDAIDRWRANNRPENTDTYDRFLLNDRAHHAVALSVPAIAVQSADSGFDWSSAGIGSALTLGIVLVCAALAATRGTRRTLRAS